MAYNNDQAFLSSPDPLNDSPTFSSPLKPHASKIQRSLPLQGSSPRKQTFQLDVGDQLSPQKIRVTVEAEHSEGNINNGRRNSGGRNLASPTPYRIPTVRQSVRTTTTTIPVKGLSDSEDDSFDSASEKPTRGRGQPRKSFGTPIPAKSRNRAVTPGAKPSPRRRRTLGHLVDGDDSEDWDFSIGAGVEVSRGKGRSRSRSVNGAARNKSTPAAKQISSPDKTVSSTTSRKGRGRRKTLTPAEIIIHEDGIDTTPNPDVRDNGEGLDTKGVLAQRDMNLVPKHSANLTNHPTTITRNDDPDVLHDKFSPAKKTPAQAGRSSSRVRSTIVGSSTGSVADLPPGSAKLPVKSPSQPVASGDARKCDWNENHPDDENEIDEIREFDTILESEGFSMISVDSVPSLREHLSSPFGLNQSGLESESKAANKDLPGLKNDNSACHEDSFSSIPPEILEAATPKRKASNPLLRAVLSANIPGDGDSFSSIPPEILEAATPGKQKSSSKFLSVKLQDRKSNDDSFSSIPPAILEAATPAKRVQTEATRSNAQSSPKESKPVTKLAIISSFPLLETGKRSLTSSGLLTPNETPSPTEMAAQQAQIDCRESNALDVSEPCKLPLIEGSSMVDSQIRSSPPSAAPHRFTYTAPPSQSESLYANNMETPSIVFSSPSLPPLIQQLPLDRSHTSPKLDPNQPPRQSLSPIVRAGRVLQDIAVTSTSRGRTQSLGSPFKSPVAQRNPIGTSLDYFESGGAGEKPQKPLEKGKGKGSDLFVGFSDDTRREPRGSVMIGEELARNQKRGAMVNPTSLAPEEDPFRSGNQSIHSTSPEEGKEYSLELPSHKAGPHTGLTREDQQYQDSICSEGAMSWQAESAVPVPMSHIDVGKTGKSNIIETTELFQQRREAEWARERAAVSSQIESASPSKVIIIESDGEEDLMNLNGEVDDAGEDIWQVEARHSSSLLEEQRSKVPPREVPLERPRRSKIPSPWRKNSKRLVYSDELAQLSSPQQPENIGRLSSDVQVKPQNKPGQITVRKRVSTHEVVEGDEDLPESSIMWHIPQKLNFTPRPRSSGNLDLSALLASSPFKMPQPASKLHSTPGPLVNDTSRDNVLKSADVELATTSSSTPDEADSQDPNEESQSVGNSFQEDSTVESTSTSYEESELAFEPSHINSGIYYPALPNIASLSPQKSCLRTPTSNSPTKSVAFVSPTPSPPPLSAAAWSKAHWKLLHAIYNDSKTLPVPPPNINSKNGTGPNHETGESAVEPSKYLGKMIQARGVKLTLEQWHLDIVREFREEVPGWDEGVIAKRLFAIIVGEDLRRQGKEYSIEDMSHG
jgi:serine/arginine repetitive matrix protein 2